MSNADSNLANGISGTHEHKIVWLLCLLAAVHVFVFSAAFPFFNNVDEANHFDLTVKYSHGHLPGGPELVSAESMQDIAIFGSQEFLWKTNFFTNGQLPPPPWTQSPEVIRRYLTANEMARQQIVNYENSQPPFYYALAGIWRNIGEWCGFENGRLLYWGRFLNMFLVAALVWVGYVAARMIFPEQCFLRLGVPALLAFIPQTQFYSIQNDVLSPLCFGVAFVFLVQWWWAERPTVRLGIITGLMLAATYLTKISNLPLVILAAGVVLLKVRHWLKAGQMRAELPPLGGLALCALLPMICWLAWTKHAFGDFTGSTAKIKILGWTQKPFTEWWHHPIFTPHGLWTFLSGTLATLWQGEFLWHRAPLAFRGVDLVYAISSMILTGIALVNLLPQFKAATSAQRQALWLGFWSVCAVVAFLGFVSIIYDFHDCFYPSRAHPYFTSGRLMLGALVPFLLLVVYGLDRAFSSTKKLWPRWLALAGFILFVLVSEITTDWPVFFSKYNWFHM
ncbi:MAG: DUF2142 domain-containing protein [Verrucomicrobiota bacterium]